MTPILSSDFVVLARAFRGHFFHRFRDRIPVPELHALLDGIETDAVATGFPLLVLPLLAEERLRQAANSAPARLDEMGLCACA